MKKSCDWDLQKVRNLMEAVDGLYRVSCAYEDAKKDIKFGLERDWNKNLIDVEKMPYSVEQYQFSLLVQALPGGGLLRSKERGIISTSLIMDSKVELFQGRSVGYVYPFKPQYLLRTFISDSGSADLDIDGEDKIINAVERLKEPTNHHNVLECVEDKKLRFRLYDEFVKEYESSCFENEHINEIIFSSEIDPCAVFISSLAPQQSHIFAMMCAASLRLPVIFYDSKYNYIRKSDYGSAGFTMRLDGAFP